MNEKINDLMYHAGLTAQGCWDSMDNYDQEVILKFAELIVRECMGVTVNYPHPVTKLTAAEHIARHFGVQE